MSLDAGTPLLQIQLCDFPVYVKALIIPYLHSVHCLCKAKILLPILLLNILVLDSLTKVGADAKSSAPQGLDFLENLVEQLEFRLREMELRLEETETKMRNENEKHEKEKKELEAKDREMEMRLKELKDKMKRGRTSWRKRRERWKQQHPN